MPKFKTLNNWRTTVAGLAMILSAVSRMHALADLTHSDIYGELAGGVGLIVCADAKKEEPPCTGNS